jgi:hypothetical protein
VLAGEDLTPLVPLCHHCHIGKVHGQKHASWQDEEAVLHQLVAAKNERREIRAEQREKRAKQRKMMISPDKQEMVTQEMITLREAVDRLRRETGWASAYDEYRRRAAAGRRVFDDQYGVPSSARKVGGTWRVSVEELESGIKAHAEEKAKHADEKAKIARYTVDYERRILHGDPGQTIRTEWGIYTVHEGLHSTTLISPNPRRNGTQSWYCSVCWDPAETEHNNPECHTCRDWNGCGRDCTFSRAFCRKCGTSYPPASRPIRAEGL